MTSDPKKLKVRRERYSKRSDIQRGMTDDDWDLYSEQMDAFRRKYQDEFDWRDIPVCLIYDEKYLFQSF